MSKPTSRYPSGPSRKFTTTRVSGRYELPFSRQRVWWALNDPAVLQHCIKGCDELWRDDEGQFHAVFRFRVGPLQKRLEATLDVEETAPPARYDLVVSVQSGNMGAASGRAEVNLQNTDPGCRLDYIADVEVDGWLAMMGEKALQIAANRTMKLFFDRFTEALGDEAGIPSGP